jgi:hypothetical protein
MANKYLKIDITTGRTVEQEALVTSAGAGDAGKIVALDSSGRIDPTMMPVGIGADTKSVTTSEALSAGDLVNLWNDAGTLKARKADATTVGKGAIGFVLAAFGSGVTALVYFDGTISGLSGLTLGSRYYLSKTAGGVVASVAAYTAGNVVQYVGIAMSATELTFQPGEEYTLA